MGRAHSVPGVAPVHPGASFLVHRLLAVWTWFTCLPQTVTVSLVQVAASGPEPTCFLTGSIPAEVKC